MKSISLLFVLGLLTTSVSAQKSDKADRQPIGGANLGRNIVSVTPMQIMAIDIENDEPDFMVGLSYERIFNNDLLSFRLPVAMSLRKSGTFYLMPTIKIYPKKQGVVKFAVGPQLLFAMGEESYQRYVNTGSGAYYQTITENRKQFGFMLNNSINFTIARNLYAAFDYGLGIRYYDSFPRDNNYLSPFGSESSVLPIFQLNFNMGFRF